MTDNFDRDALSANLPPGALPDDPGYWAGLDAAGNGCTPEAPTPPERPAKLPLFRLSEAGEPYPVDALPPLLKEAVEAIADKTQCDPAIAAGSVLGAASLAVMAHVDVVTPHGQTVPTSLYLVTLAESGDRKSAADDLAMKAVREAEAAGQEAQRAGWNDYCCAKDAWQAAKAALVTAHKKDRAKLEAALKGLGSEPRPALDPSVTVTEPTIAGLEKTFQAARPALGLFADEGGQMLGGHAMRDESRLHTLTALNNLWQGKPIKRTRAGDGNSLLPGRRLAVHLMFQPGIAHKLLGDSEAISTGLVGRLLVVAPPSRPGTRLFKMPEAASIAALHRLEARLGKLLEKWPHHPDDPQRLMPRAVEMTNRATADWIVFHDACQERVQPGGAWEAIRAWGEKAAEQAARMAGVLAVMDNPEAAAIESLSMAQAVRLVEHYGSEVARLAGQPLLDAKTAQAASLLDWLRQKGLPRFALRTVYQNGPRTIRTAAAARDACDLLAAHGELKLLPDGLLIDGRCHKPAYRVIPD